MVWSQLNQEAKNLDSNLQKSQDYLMSSLYAVLTVCNNMAESKTSKENLTHALVLAI
jgi:hypothetical protein